MLDWKHASLDREKGQRPPAPYPTARTGAVFRGGTQQ